MSGLHVFSVWFLVMHFLRLLYIGYILMIHLYINSAIIYRCYVANNFFAKVHIFFWIWHCSPEKLVKKKTSDQKLNTVIPEQFRRLTAFADDDEEAALEIIKNVKLALNEHLQRLQNILDEANNPNTNAADTPDIKSSITPIKQVVHKMLPIATMMQMKSLDQLTALTPENIDKLDDKQIREHLQTIMTDLHNILQDK